MFVLRVGCCRHVHRTGGFNYYFVIQSSLAKGYIDLCAIFIIFFFKVYAVASKGIIMSLCGVFNVLFDSILI